LRNWTLLQREEVLMDEDMVGSIPITLWIGGSR